MNEPPAHPQDDRLRDLQEAQAFAEHRTDQISVEVLALSRRIEELSRRLASLERRLDEALSPPDEGEQNDAGETPAGG